MTKSMTGYGKGDCLCSRGRFIVEIRSVNSRYGEISVRLPRSYMSLENSVKRQVSAKLKRGKIDVTVQWEESSSCSLDSAVDLEAAKAWCHVLRQLARELGTDDTISMDTIISLKGVIRDHKKESDEGDEIEKCLEDALSLSLESLDGMRTQEGALLKHDIRERRSLVSGWVSEIRKRSMTVVEDYKNRLTARISQLLDGVEPDASRITQEVAIMADRSDITEEIVRLESHFAQFDAAFDSGEPIGRKLDFIMQEMNREVNTIGSKANDADVARMVVLIKAEFEKIREQIQNIE